MARLTVFIRHVFRLSLCFFLHFLITTLPEYPNSKCLSLAQVHQLPLPGDWHHGKRRILVARLTVALQALAEVAGTRC